METGCEVASTVFQLKDIDQRVRALEDYMGKDEEERLRVKDQLLQRFDQAIPVAAYFTFYTLKDKFKVKVHFSNKKVQDVDGGGAE